MLRIMVGHGNCRNSGLKLPYCQGQPAAGIHVDNMPSDPKEKAKVPLQKKKKRKKRKKKKRKRKAYALSLTYFPISLKTKNKSSSPQVKHNLTSKFSSTKGREEWNTAFTSSADLVYFVIQTGIRKSNLNKTRLNVIVKNKTKKKTPKTPTKKKKKPQNQTNPPTHSRLSLIPINFKSKTPPVPS